MISISPLTTIYLWHGIWDDSFHNCLTASPYSVNVIPSLIIDYINYLSYFPTKITTVHAKLLQSCPTPCDLMNHSLPGSSVHRILQARILEWVAISFSKGSSWCRNQTQVSCIAGRFFTDWATSEALYWSGQMFPSPGELPNPRIEPRSPTLQADSLPFEPPGKPTPTFTYLFMYDSK